MEKVYNITDVKFDNDFLILIIDNQAFKLRLTEISDKLAMQVNWKEMTLKFHLPDMEYIGDC